MIKKLCIALVVLIPLVAVAISTNRPTGKLTLAWDYPEENDTSLVFRVYHTTNILLPLSTWQFLTNAPTPTNRTLEVHVTPGVNFFFMTASNFWLESDPSNVLPLPALPRSNVNMRATRAN